jgi:hypothetical protein
MRRLDRALMAGAYVLVAACTATKPPTTYWTQKSGVVVVHHVVGTTDSVEKLMHTQLSADELKAAALPKGTYFKVVPAQGPVTPAATPTATANKVHAAKEDSLAELEVQLRALKNQVKTVETQNQRLQEELDTAATQKTAQQEPANRPADQDQDVRMSQ